MTTRAARCIALAFISSCLLATASQADDPPSTIVAAVDRAVRPLLTEYDVPGIAVAVTVDGRQYFFSYGVAEKDTNRPVTKDTLFEIALAAETYGVRSTSADMIRFVEAQVRPETVEAPMRRAIERTHVGYFKIGQMVQGLGWEQYPYPVTLDRLLAGNSTAMIMEPQAATRLTPPRTPSQPTLFNKTGSTNGFGAYVAFVPEKKIGVVMLANKNLPIPARVTAVHAVLEQLSTSANSTSP